MSVTKIKNSDCCSSKEALVVRHCVTLWPRPSGHHMVPVSRLLPMADDSSRFSNNRSTKNANRQSCIPLCNIESSSGTSSHANFIWKEALMKKRFLRKSRFDEGCSYVSRNLVQDGNAFDHCSTVSDRRMQPADWNGSHNNFNMKWGLRYPFGLAVTESSYSVTESSERNTTYVESYIENTIDGNSTIEDIQSTPLAVTAHQLQSLETPNIIVNVHGKSRKQYRRNKIDSRSHQERKRRKRAKMTPSRDLISDNLCLALTTTFLCCSPIGLIALYYVWKVRRSLTNNKIEDAWLFSLRGKKIANTGVKIGITALAFVLLVLVVKHNVPYSSPEYDYDVMRFL